MNRSSPGVRLAIALAFVVATGVTSVQAEDAKLPKTTCFNIKWNAGLLKSFPRAPAACQEVVKSNGTQYARFDATITEVDKDGVSVRFLNVAGDPGREMRLKPGANAMVRIGDRKVDYSKLSKGDKMTFWVPEDRIGVISDPSDTAESTIVIN